MEPGEPTAVVLMLGVLVLAATPTVTGVLRVLTLAAGGALLVVAGYRLVRAVSGS